MGTIVDTVTDNKTYYDCPGCGREVWAYGTFVGTRCWDCPGTIISAVTNATPVVRETKTVFSTLTDDRTTYRCKNCGEKVYAYGQFAGQDCLKCKDNNPIKAAFDIGTEVVGAAAPFSMLPKN